MDILGTLINILGTLIGVLVPPAINFAVIRLFTTPLQAVKCCYYSNNGPFYIFFVE